MKYKIFALFGKSGAGKDRLLKSVVNTNSTLNEIVSCTTRPPRDGETNGVNYNFVSIEDFYTKVCNGDMLEATQFRDWWYGTELSSLNSEMPNIGVFNIDGIECLLEDSRLEIYPILIDATDKTRLIRQLNRESNPDVAEIIRRYGTDEKDFDIIPFEYDIINNNENGFIHVATRELSNLIKSL